MMKAAGASLIDVLCAVLVGIAIAVAWTGGWRVELFDITLNVRSIWRPLLLAMVLLATHALGARAVRLAELSDTAARVIAGALLVAGVLGWTIYVSPYLGGADSYGYVSASERLRAGALVQTEPLAAMLPYPEATPAATPLGYVPAPHVPNASAPAYPLGLPALMAIATTVFGRRAPFYVPLAMGVVLAAACYWIRSRACLERAVGFDASRGAASDRTTALATTAAVTLHPVVFTYAIQAMSDVPATAWYLVAAALLMVERPSFAALAGLAGCGAFLTRPAMLPGLAALVLIPAMSDGHRRARLAVFAGVLAIGVAIQAWLQWHLYGSPRANGYGRIGELFSLRFLGPNMRSYAYWLVMMQGAIWIAGFIRGVFELRDRSTRALLAATIVGAVVPHAVYRTYDHWETLRFILPLLVVMTIFAVAGLFGLFRRMAGPRGGTWIGLALTIVMVAGWVRWLDREQVFALARAEARFEQAATLVARATPPDAVILSSLHSGSLRYYANRQTLDWARIPEDRFEATVAALTTRGLHVFVMLDGQEERFSFEARHARAIDGWLPAGQRRDIRLYEAP